MPALRSYKVTRVQSVEVQSTNPMDAQETALAFFDGTQKQPEINGVPFRGTAKVSMSAEER